MTKTRGPQPGQRLILSDGPRLVIQADAAATADGTFVVLTTESGQRLATLIHCLWPGRAGPGRYRTTVHRASTGSMRPEGSALFVADHPDAATSQAAHAAILSDLRHGLLLSRLTLERLEAVRPSLDRANAAMAVGDVTGAIAELDRALSALTAQDPDRFFFPAYQALYLMRAAAWECVDRRRAVEAYQAFIETCSHVHPTPETVRSASLARKAMDWLRAYGREARPASGTSAPGDDRGNALFAEAPAREREEE